MSDRDINAVMEILSEYDNPHNFAGAPPEGDSSELRTHLDAYFGERECEQAVLGIDIYQYSRFDNEKQRLIPTIFRILYQLAVGFCDGREKFIFQKERLKDRFIPTGDGGFQIVATPLHALLFAVQFQVAVTLFNSFFIFPKLRNWIGPITLRYAITLDTVFEQDNNFYGAAIITNARILSRDVLNRCLIDARSVNWFYQKVINVESLMTLGIDQLCKISPFAEYKLVETDDSMFFPSKGSFGAGAIRSIHLQKIGAIPAKTTMLDVYSIQLQVSIIRIEKDDLPARDFLVTLGNLNASGIS